MKKGLFIFILGCLFLVVRGQICESLSQIPCIDHSDCEMTDCSLEVDCCSQSFCGSPDMSPSNWMAVNAALFASTKTFFCDANTTCPIPCKKEKPKVQYEAKCIFAPNLSSRFQCTKALSRDSALVSSFCNTDDDCAVADDCLGSLGGCSCFVPDLSQSQYVPISKVALSNFTKGCNGADVLYCTDYCVGAAQTLNMYPVTKISCVRNNCVKIQVADRAVGDIMIAYTVVGLIMVVFVLGFAVYKHRQAKKEENL